MGAVGKKWELGGKVSLSNGAMREFEALAHTASLQFGVLTKAQLRAAGLSEDQVWRLVKKGWLRRKSRGLVTLAGTPDDWNQQAAAAALAAWPLGGVSHRTAGRFWKFRDVDSEVEVSIRYPRQLSIPGAIVHRSVDLLETDLTWYEGIPVTTPVRTICDYGLIFPESEVLRVLKHQIATGRLDRHEVAELRRRIGKSGRNGAGVIGRCLDELPDRAEQAESGIEVDFLALCREYRVPEPVIQLPVVAQGRRYRLDFCYPNMRIFIEIDGKGHAEPDQIASDDFRQNNLVASGWHPVRFTSEQMALDASGCASTVLRVLRLSDEFHAHGA